MKAIQNQTLADIRSRRSVKKYTDQPVPRELVEAVVEAGMYAPSGMNRQSAIILAVTDKEMRDRLSRMNLDIILGKQLQTSSGHGDPFYGAPVVLVVLAKKACPTRVYDGSIVLENMLLAAHSLGLGACWIHRAKEMFETEEGQQLLRDLGITEEYEGIGHCILGYAAPDALKPQSPRKPDYVRWV